MGISHLLISRLTTTCFTFELISIFQKKKKSEKKSKKFIKYHIHKKWTFKISDYSIYIDQFDRIISKNGVEQFH